MVQTPQFQHSRMTPLKMSRARRDPDTTCEARALSVSPTILHGAYIVHTIMCVHVYTHISRARRARGDHGALVRPCVLGPSRLSRTRQERRSALRSVRLTHASRRCSSLLASSAKTNLCCLLTASQLTARAFAPPHPPSPLARGRLTARMAPAPLSCSAASGHLLLKPPAPSRCLVHRTGSNSPGAGDGRWTGSPGGGRWPVDRRSLSPRLAARLGRAA